MALRRQQPCEETLAVQNIEEETGQDIFEDHKMRDFSRRSPFGLMCLINSVIGQIRNLTHHECSDASLMSTFEPQRSI
jgi:hypothetical protein